MFFIHILDATAAHHSTRRHYLHTVIKDIHMNFCSYNLIVPVD